MREGVSVRLTADGYIVTSPATEVVGHGPTEADAWTDFWGAYHAEWKPPQTDAPGLQDPPAIAPTGRKRGRATIIRVRDLFR